MDNLQLGFIILVSSGVGFLTANYQHKKAAINLKRSFMEFYSQSTHKLMGTMLKCMVEDFNLDKATVIKTIVSTCAKNGILIMGANGPVDEALSRTMER